MFCSYCLRRIPVVPRRNTCGRELCRSRTASWNAWVNGERTRAISGDVNKPQAKARRLPAFSAKAVQLFDMTIEHLLADDEEVAA
jgi:hypothetical protein